MFELSKEVLQKVSFDRALFVKELEKAINWLQGEEVLQLKKWCINTFGNNYQEDIVYAFKSIS